MTFANYQNSNNASSKLLADISASTTIILITSGEEALFPNSYPFLLTIEKVNSDGNVILREIVKVVSGNQNSFVVERGAGKCVQDDTATTRIQSNATHSFSAGDRISLYWTAEQVKDIQDDLNSKLSIEEYQSGNYVYGASTTGNDDYAITLPIAPTSYAIGQVYRFLAGTENTGPATLNVNGLGAVAIKKNHDIALDTGDIEAGQIVEVAYDGTNFQMNSQTATIVDMKDIKTLSFSGLKAGQDLQEGDVVQIKTDGFDESVATESDSVGGISGPKVAIGFEANGDTIQDLQIKASVIEGTTPTAITVNLESDNNGSPSGTVLSTVDILNNLSGNVNISSITETQKDAFGESGYVYMGGGNLGKTRCFYSKQESWNLTSSQSGKFYRHILSANSSTASSTPYTIPASAFLSALGKTGTHTYHILYIDQDFKFMFIYDDGNMMHKLGFEAPEGGGSIDSFTLLGSRALSTLGINAGGDYMQIAFSDDGKFVYSLSHGSSSTSGSLMSYSLDYAYDLTGATQIGTSITIGSYTSGPVYLSLLNGKKYVALGYTSNRYVRAREINSDGTIGTESIIRNGSTGAAYQRGIAIGNYANGGACVILNYQNGDYRYSYFYELGIGYFTSPTVINFSLGSSYLSEAGQKYWITIAPIGDSVQNYMNLYSASSDEDITLAVYTDSWSLVSGRSPFLQGNGVVAPYIVKQFESNIPFGNYGIIDNDYQAFQQARFVNMGYCEHFTGLSAGRQYYMNNGYLSTEGGQYLGTAISERILNIGKREEPQSLPEKDVSSKINNIVAAESGSSQRSTSQQGCLFTAKTSGYYTAIGTIAATSTAKYLKFYVDGTQKATQTIVCGSSGTSRSFVCIPVYLDAGQSGYLQLSTAAYIGHMFIVGPDGSV